ncbi:hypothetical protein ACN47E_004558 [Coniothyrium glycines]
MANPDEDEWEYEYDEVETEDVYIPLDLTNVPAAQIPMVSQGRPGHPTLLKTRLRALNAARGQPVEFAPSTAEGQETATMGEVQVIGLHTTNPLVMYNGQLLSCHWGTTIGTDMFFVKPSANDDPAQPLRSLPSVDLLSLGSAKLVAKVGRLRPRDELFNNDNAVEAIELLNPTDNQPQPSDGVEAQRVPTEQARPASDSFLARLNAAKAKRGESTRLAVSQASDGVRLVNRSDAIEAPAQDTLMDGT